MLSSSAKSLPDLGIMHTRVLRKWLGELDTAAPASSNTPALALPCQRWFKFKEAFSPALVMDCLKDVHAPVRSCLDPFGGCGTTGVTCQFLGIKPVLVEVNPFVADLAEAKLASYDRLELLDDFASIVRTARSTQASYVAADWLHLPATFCEPGSGDRWLYSKEAFARIVAYRTSIDCLRSETNARLFRVLLGSILVGSSNVVVNGKGRKYRRNWTKTQKGQSDIDRQFANAFLRAIEDVERYARRAESSYSVIRGSCNDVLARSPLVDVAIFSPPYPNSFDYTDIYNIELWVLGYLTSAQENVTLRQATLRSHVQCTFEKSSDNVVNPLLRRTLRRLEKVRADLWDPRIPQMIAGYFDDLSSLLINLREVLRSGGSAFIVVGDSCYRDVPVRVADILSEIADGAGFEVRSKRVIRRMRMSAQQGGGYSLNESVLHIRKRSQ